MAGIAKIISKTIDDVAKIAGKVLIGLGDAAVGDVLSPKTFYAGDTTLKTGTMPTVAIVAANDNYPEGYHAGDVGGLDAIETNLAPGNIKNGVTIFGKLGTFSQTLAEDIKSATVTPDQIDTSTGAGHHGYSITLDNDTLLVSKTQDYDANSMAIAGCAFACGTGLANRAKIRLWMEGIQMAESPFVAKGPSGPGSSIELVAQREMSGSQECKLTGRGYDNTTLDCYGPNYVTGYVSVGIVIGSVKI